ncbi:hypothetical protein Tco_1457916 [Tanacetum coccineum]
MAVEVPQTLEYRGDQLNAAPMLEVDFQDSPDNEEDTRSSQEYLNDLKEEYQAKALLAKSKRFFRKGSQRFSGAKATEDTQCYKCVKASHALLSLSASISNSRQDKGLVAETYDWDEEEVSSDEEELVEVKSFMALAEEERAPISKDEARNGEWVQISMSQVHTLLKLEDNDDRKSLLNHLCTDINYVEDQRNNLLSKHRDLVKTLNSCKEKLFLLEQTHSDFLSLQHENTETLKENKYLRE